MSRHTHGLSMIFASRLLVASFAIRFLSSAAAQCVPDALLRTLANPGPASTAFGASVAIGGNVAVVGDPRADPGGVTDAGIAYVFDAVTAALLITLNNPA